MTGEFKQVLEKAYEEKLRVYRGNVNQVLKELRQKIEGTMVRFKSVSH